MCFTLQIPCFGQHAATEHYTQERQGFTSRLQKRLNLRPGFPTIQHLWVASNEWFTRDLALMYYVIVTALSIYCIERCVHVYQVCVCVHADKHVNIAVKHKHLGNLIREHAVFADSPYLILYCGMIKGSV